MSPRTFDSLKASPQSLNRDQLALAFAVMRLSCTPDGQTLLAWLRQTSIETVLTAGDSDSALRMMEGRRQVHAEIWNLIRRGELESRKPQPES